MLNDIRLGTLAIAAVGFFLMATTANAVTVDLTIVAAGTTGTIAGDTVTFGPGGGTLELDLAVTNTPPPGVQSLGVSIVARQSSSPVDFGDIATVASTAEGPQLLFDAGTFTGLPTNTPFVSAANDINVDVLRALQSVATTPALGTGLSDPSPQGGNGGQLSITLTVTDSGTIGLEQVFGDSTAPSQTTTLNGLITIAVPEPSVWAANFAILGALGFVAVAGRRRRSAETCD